MTDATMAGELSADELSEARRYARNELVCSIADILLDLLVLAMFAFVLVHPIEAWLASFPALENYWLRLAALFAVYFAFHLVISFPLAWYSGFRLEHLFGLSHLTLWGWLVRYAKRNSLVFVFGLIMIEGLFLLLWAAGPWWWLVSAVTFFLVSVLMGQLAPVLILPLFYQVDRLDNDALLARFAGLAKDTGLKISGVYRMALSQETAKANAMLAGLGNTRRVILGDTLLDSFSDDEIDVVLAHEIGHHVHRHIPQLMVVGAVYGLVSFYVAAIALEAYVGVDGVALDYSQVPLVSMPLLLLAITIMSFALSPLQNWLMRRFEREADRFALARTQSPGAYRSAFLKLARQNKDDPDPPWLEVFLFHDHPPIRERLALADLFAADESDKEKPVAATPGFPAAHHRADGE